MSPSIILITGATGFLGSEIALEALRTTPHSVRLAVRKLSQGDAWNAEYPQYKDRVEFTQVESLDAEGAFDDAVKGVEYVVHAASPATFTPEDNKRDLLDPAINGVLSILHSANKTGKVKAFIMTSSVAAYLDRTNLPKVGETVDSSYWNPMTYDQAAAQPKNMGALVYSASKALAEKAARDYVEKEKPSFYITTIAPTWVLGHNSEPTLKSWKDLRSSFGITVQTIVDKEKCAPTFALDYVNVLDVAKAHVGAILHPENASGKRYLLSGRYSNEAAAYYAAKAVPAQAHRFPSIASPDIAPSYNLESASAEKDFGFNYIGLEETVAEWAKQLFSLPKA